MYGDHDPLVVAHGRALYSDDRAGWIHADISETEDVLEEASDWLDLTRPVVVSMINVAENLPDPHMVVSVLMAGLPPGSGLAMAQAASDLAPEVMAEVTTVYRVHGIEFAACTRGEFASYFDGLELNEDVTPPHRMWGPCPDGLRDEQVLCWAGCGWKR